MGVDFQAFSNVIIRPIPEKYKAITFTKKICDQESLIKAALQLKDKSSTDLSLEQILIFQQLMKRTYSDGSYINADEINVTNDAQQWSDELSQDSDFIHIDWHQNVYYSKSPDTQQASSSLSYSSFYEFNDLLIRLKGKSLNFMIPDTDTPPWYGILNKEEVLYALEDYLFAKSRINDIDIDYHDFITQMISCLETAKNNGIFLVY